LIASVRMEARLLKDMSDGAICVLIQQEAIWQCI
jgi:hypothetical protein